MESTFQINEHSFPRTHIPNELEIRAKRVNSYTLTSNRPIAALSIPIQHRLRGHSSRYTTAKTQRTDAIWVSEGYHTNTVDQQNHCVATSTSTHDTTYCVKYFIWGDSANSSSLKLLSKDVK